MDLEYYSDSKGKRMRCYSLLWTNRLAAETKSVRLVRHEGGIIGTEPLSETMSAVSERLSQCYAGSANGKSQPTKKAAASSCMPDIDAFIRRKFSQADRAAARGTGRLSRRNQFGTSQTLSHCFTPAGGKVTR